MDNADACIFAASRRDGIGVVMSTQSAPSQHVVIQQARVTVPHILSRKNSPKKIAVVTAYDYTSARIIDSTDIDVVLVGDSAGSVIQGLETTLPVTLDEIVYHTRCVQRGLRRALLVADLPFLSYQVSPEDALRAAGRCLKEAGAHAVKLEGGIRMAETIARLSDVDIPVMGHVGLTPQSYHRIGGFKIQGSQRSQDSATIPAPGTRERVLADAKAVEAAGAFAVVLECIPADLAQQITAELRIPTIGIGAGPECDGQVLVFHDLLGLNGDHVPRFVKRYLEGEVLVRAALQEYCGEVQKGVFPPAISPATTKKVAANG